MSDPEDPTFRNWRIHAREEYWKDGQMPTCRGCLNPMEMEDGKLVCTTPGCPDPKPQL